MKIVLTDAQTVLDDIVNADVLNRFGEVESFGLLHSFLNTSITLRNIIGLFRTASGKEAKLFHRLYIR